MLSKLTVVTGEAVANAIAVETIAIEYIAVETIAVLAEGLFRNILLAQDVSSLAWGSSPGT